MNTLKAAYRILNALEHKDRSLAMSAQIGPDAIGVEQADWLDVINALLDDGYITGITVKKDILGETSVDMRQARITMKGAEYLHENSTMKKIANVAADILDIVT